jgi:hypothetical protein
MNAHPALGLGAVAIEIDFDNRLAMVIDAHTKGLITDAYSFGLCTEELAIQLIRESGLRCA